MKLINLKLVHEIHHKYPSEFIRFCKYNELKFPNISTKNGKALCVMLHHRNYYWDRETCDLFIKKFNIQSKDSIQLFNKHEQWGIKTSHEKGKYYIVYPYSLSNKYKMRKNFKYTGNEDEKNMEINKIKETIQHDYLEIPNEEWHIGHKNPESPDNTRNNMILQPPIQAKYRDKFIFIDTLTKIPTPKTLKQMIKNNTCPYTKQQLIELKDFFFNLEIEQD